MPYDYKKEDKYLYQPPMSPTIVQVPPMNYIAVRGKGNPNDKDGAYQNAISVLYAIAFTLKMSHKGTHNIQGYFEYVVPPLEGFWWQEEVDGVDFNKKEAFQWISVIRLPDFIKEEDVLWAIKEAERKKKMDLSAAEFLTINEGLCVQIMHTGVFDDEPETVERMNKYLRENGYVHDFSEERLHHEIYLSDPRRVQEARLKTVIRHPIRKL